MTTTATPVATLTITHTHEAGTLIEGTARGDGSAEVLKGQRWRWGRSIGAWFVPNSRDRLPAMHTINATRDALTAAGFAVELEVSTERRDMAEVEAGKIERQAARVEALEAKAQRKDAADDAAYARALGALKSLPEGGEPIKIGHHSEGRHRAGIAKADRAMRASVEAGKAASEARAKAEIASHTTDARYAPARVARRIETLEVDGRKLARSIERSQANAEEGRAAAEMTEDDTRRFLATDRAERAEAHTARLQLMADENAEQLEYWRGIRAAQIEEGKAGDYSPATIAKGDLVRYRFANAAIVIRVNPKTVTAAYWPRWDAENMHTDTIAYGDLTAHTVPTDDQRAQLLAKAKEGAAKSKARHAAALASLGGRR
ncbi:DUF3560 domain-containing protein [Microbacterium sp. zg-YB36]|uniref:DUF3560 domain-containing protein n=1 Tax=Microbacterium sp. zg-YB36 TaxID=2969407 RepID=UPI00214CA5DF|nr:DUF3560 domain-containing protein [Microbacterium sp. zg-YB36]MDL5351158.1 DUF3560 domain-containing protein [Microbacterium sp. zg-YB36]